MHRRRHHGPELSRTDRRLCQSSRGFMRRERVILILHGDAAVKAAITSAANGSLVSHVPDWDALSIAIITAPPSAVAVVDPYFGTSGSKQAFELRDLLHRFTSASIVPILKVTPSRASDVAMLDEWGIASIISTGHDDTPAAISHRLGDACVRPLKRLLASILPATTSPHAFPLLCAAAETIADGGTVADFASSVNASPSTLLRWCEEARLPNPRTILQWVRVLLSSKYLEEQERTIESIATSCGYASPAELRKVTLRLVGLSPAQIRTEGGFQTAAGRFAATLIRPTAAIPPRLPPN